MFQKFWNKVIRYVLLLSLFANILLGLWVWRLDVESKISLNDPLVTVQVTRVVDGDTIEILFRGAKQKVRYLGIDTPEKKPGKRAECFAEEATARNIALVLNKRVTLVRSGRNRDRYGRLLRYVEVGDVFVNGELLSGGFAKVAYIKKSAPRYGELMKFQMQAQKEMRGMWSACK